MRRVDSEGRRGEFGVSKICGKLSVFELGGVVRYTCKEINTFLMNEGRVCSSRHEAVIPWGHLHYPNVKVVSDD